MYLYVAETNPDEEENPTIHIKHEITQEELDEVNSAFQICGIYHSITQIKEIVVENGMDFQRYMDPNNLNKLRAQKMTPERMILTANKYVLNYAASIKTYLDMECRLLQKNGKEESIKSFNDLCHKFYDEHAEYRFWANFRNYVVHCEFPYSVFREEVSKGCAIVCNKDHLLQFNNWKHSKKDIQQMGEEINLPAMVNAMSSLIIALYIEFFAYFGEEIVLGIKEYGEFCRKNEVERPIIYKNEIKEKIEGGCLQPLPVSDLFASFQVLQSNPHVRINITN